MSYTAIIAKEFNVREDYVNNIIALLDEGNMNGSAACAGAARSRQPVSAAAVIFIACCFVIETRFLICIAIPPV